METLPKYEDFVNEAHVTVKRKYTDNYPRKRVYDGAKVRNAIFKAIGDGVITEDEIKKILSEMGADVRWPQRHKYFFIIKESGKKKTYKLAPKAKKVIMKYKKKLDISEDRVKENLANLLTMEEFLTEMEAAKIKDKKSTKGWVKGSISEDVGNLKSGTEVLVDKDKYESSSDDDNIEIFHEDAEYFEVLKKLIKLK